MQRKTRTFLILIVLAGFCFCAYQLASYFWGLEKDNAAFERLSNLVATSVPMKETATLTPVSTASLAAAITAQPLPVSTEEATLPPANLLSSALTDIEAPVVTATPETTEIPTPALVPTVETKGSPILVPATASDNEDRAMLENYRPLYEMNPDIFGWLRIDGTMIDYPVMFTPNQPQYYLKRNFDGQYSSSGMLFIDESCYEGCGNYLIHGHHMHNGSMFGELNLYADEEYWQEHPVIHFETLYEQGKYEIIAVFYGKVYANHPREVFDNGHMNASPSLDFSENAIINTASYEIVPDSEFLYYYYTDLTMPESFAEYMAYLKSVTLYDTGAEAEFGDELITLSTCEYHTTNGRFVVVARKIRSEDAQ